MRCSKCLILLALQKTTKLVQLFQRLIGNAQLAAFFLVIDRHPEADMIAQQFFQRAGISIFLAASARFWLDRIRSGGKSLSLAYGEAFIDYASRQLFGIRRVDEGASVTGRQ